MTLTVRIGVVHVRVPGAPGRAPIAETLWARNGAVASTATLDMQARRAFAMPAVIERQTAGNPENRATLFRAGALQVPKIPH